ncbi:hypothetical protein FDECE_12565 [Fusarium decemcellulare]|nr:hypothetical protein FDECE_12565 [Fusarium decemcellulare]
MASHSESTVYSPTGQEATSDVSTTPHRANPKPDKASLDQLIPFRHNPHKPSHQPLNNSWWRRVGLSGLLVLIIGTLVILASAAILLFLWVGAEAAKHRHDPAFWKTIIIREWAPRVVTICSAAMRTSIALQIGLVVAAAAAIMLETSGALLVDTPILSINRALKGTALDILPSTIRRYAAGGIAGPFHLIIAAMALIITIGSTFISTILLSDFQTRQIAGPAITETVAISSSSLEQFANGASYWKSRPSSQWRFAEVKKNESYHVVGDTGDTFRAMLPFSWAESRTSLEHYSGPAVVANFRTMCTPPNIRNISFNHGLHPEVQYLETMYVELNETMSPNILGSSYRERTAYGDYKFSHSTRTRVLDNPFSSSPDSWLLSLYSDTAEFWGKADPFHDDVLSLKRFLLFNSTRLLNETLAPFYTGDYQMTTDYDFRNETVDSVLEDLDDLSWRNESLWAKVSNRNGSELFSITACYFNVTSPATFKVSLSGHSNEFEPLNEPQPNAKQFGIGTPVPNYEDRGILQLDIGPQIYTLSDPDADKNYDLIKQARSYKKFSSLLSDAVDAGSWNDERSWALSDDKQTMFYARDWSAHSTHTSLFQSIIQQTEDPALAVQALITRLYQMSYYDWLPDYDQRYPVETVHTTERLIPARWVGLGIVLGLVGLHFALVIITIAVFATLTETSTLGNTWQTVAQIISPQTREIIESADDMTDKGVEMWVKEMGRDGEVCGVSRSPESGRIEVQLHKRR